VSTDAPAAIDRCAACGDQRRDHVVGQCTVQLGRCRCEGFVDPGPPPLPEEMAEALAVTEWTCPFCGADQDVWGEGALYSWMQVHGLPAQRVPRRAG
jgi:hypothetical protein